MSVHTEHHGIRSWEDWLAEHLARFGLPEPREWAERGSYGGFFSKRESWL